MRRLSTYLAALVLLATVAGAADKPADPPEKKAEPTYAGEEMCTACHEEQATAYTASRHRVLSKDTRPEAQRGCEACHGPGGTHAEEAGAAFEGLQTFAAGHPAAERSAPCLSCHGGGPGLHDARASEHALAGVGCPDCHHIHGSGDHLLRKSVPELCYGCHIDVRAKFKLPEHHKVPEGVMTCLDCHEVHGSRRFALMRGSDARGGCERCHADLQGPFVYEHGGLLIEGCQRCHDPHGSLNRHLLIRQQVAQLCYECHTVTPSSHVQPSYRDCTRCHTAIHGSNFSAQLLEP
jgi:DmsE family decaheme c-type cytochrome